MHTLSARPLLRVSRLCKAFAAPVLKDVELSVHAGEVVALTGENGAGKSTLLKIVAGVLAADAGEMFLDDQPYEPRTRADAESRGVRMVLQELGLIGNLSVAENLCLGQIPSRFGFIKRREMEQIAREQLARVGLSEVDPGRMIDELGIGRQQLVEIARGLMGRVRVLILDEPTAMLTESETVRLFQQINLLRAQGVAVIYISHRLAELRRIADRIVVLRNGCLVADRPAQGFAHDELVRAMTGGEASMPSSRPARPRGSLMLKVAGFNKGQTVRDVSFEIYSGEILGVAGLVGAGRTELLRLIFGADRKDSGELFLDGSSVPVEVDSPARAVAFGIGLVPEDRKSQGLLLTQSIRANVTLANLRAVSRIGWIDRHAEGATVSRWTQSLRIRARDPDQAVVELSGGNQQKVLLARLMHRDCRILLLDEPTRGVDVGARADIYELLDTLAAAQKGLIVVSSDLEELMLICDRIAVMSAGRLVQIFERGQWSEEALLHAAFAAYQESDGVAGRPQ